MNKIIVKSDDVNYLRAWEMLSSGKYNGAYYYSQDIENYIIPNIKTDRPINLIGTLACGGEDSMVVFVHHYLNVREKYSWLRRYNDIIIVSSDYDADKELLRYGRVIHLPLSVNVSEIAKHRKKPTQKACFYGNQWGFRRKEISELVPPEVPRFGEMPREVAWDVVSDYADCYAIGLCAMEAQVLGCHIKTSRYRYPEPEKSFPILDCECAAKLLQEALDMLEEDRELEYVDCAKLKGYKKALKDSRKKANV